jgi:hypothetical protein
MAALPADCLRTFLDTAPLIHVFERSAAYFSTVESLLADAEARNVTLVTSPHTLAEVLVAPLKQS